MTDAPERVWAKAQEWPKGSGRIEVYASAVIDADEPSTEYTRTDMIPALGAVSMQRAAVRAVNGYFDADISREACDALIKNMGYEFGVWSASQIAETLLALRTALDAAEADTAEMTRRRDEWRAKADGYDAVRLALRDAIAGKFGEEGPLKMSRILWAGVAADEKKRADHAEADKQRAVMREQRLARRIHMQRAQLRWLNARMAGDLQITRMHMLRKTLLTKRVPTSFGPDPSALRAVWDVVLRRVYGTSAIRAQGGAG